jgi:hypothetical protein
MQNKPPFIVDAAGSKSSSPSSGGGGMDAPPNRPTVMGGDVTLNQDSVPTGGAILKADPKGNAGNSGTVSDVSGVAHKPFKLGATPAGESMPSASVGSVGDAD